ncbi:MAG: hypothetical protein E6R03_08065 [Hyphomicrobiaceae bacterium]|nr:MAG: hypothetical protein E6R03_08065 [Hyphomicrobiaceae bacterium]
MARRPHPRGTTTNPSDGPWQTCQRCGFVVSQSRISFQFDYMGGPTPMNTGLMVCGRCLDVPNEQFRLLILPPDPAPIFNTNPEPYAIDETNWLTTQDDEIITTQDDALITPTEPNPANDPNTAYLSASLSYPSGSVATLYLDLFIGDPAAGGVSVLATITGSATRTNIASSVGTDANDLAITFEEVVISSASASITNVNHIGFYSAASGGTLLVSGPVSATFPTIIEGVRVVIAATALQIQL